MKLNSILLALLLCIGCQSKPTKQQNIVTPDSNQSKKESKKAIVFFGDSITAGYQLDLSEAFPALIQKRLDSLYLPYQTVNAGLSGETSASGASRVAWVLKTKVDVFVLELGANDGLRGLEVKETRKNLQLIIDQVLERYPDCKIVLAGMQIPPNMGQEYSKGFQKLFVDLSKTNNLPFIPFILDGVAGHPELNLADGIHPTAEGHQILMENIWKVLVPLL